MITMRVRLWKIAVAGSVVALLALNFATHTLRTYHWFLVLAIPAAWWAGDRGRSFFLDWLPLFCFWIAYDRLRLVQPFLLGRVSVRWPYALEQWLFGWLGGGATPPQSARAWLAAYPDARIASMVSWCAQLVYLSHIFTVPLLLLSWWILRWFQPWYRRRFTRHVYALTVLNALGLLSYILLPVAPPWWVGIWGMTQPSASLVASTQVSRGMDGKLIQELIKTAPDWFAAIPSLHGAYPVLLGLLAWKNLKDGALLAIGLYGAAMWTSCVLLNQHYIIDLIAGGVAALVAWKIGDWLYLRGRSNCLSGVDR